MAPISKGDINGTIKTNKGYYYFKELKEKLMRNPKNAFLKLEESEIEKAFDFLSFHCIRSP